MICIKRQIIFLFIGILFMQIRTFGQGGGEIAEYLTNDTEICRIGCFYDHQKNMLSCYWNQSSNDYYCYRDYMWARINSGEGTDYYTGDDPYTVLQNCLTQSQLQYLECIQSSLGHFDFCIAGCG